jgi:hypothetical protein
VLAGCGGSETRHRIPGVTTVAADAMVVAFAPSANVCTSTVTRAPGGP